MTSFEKTKESFQFVDDFIAFMEESCWVLHSHDVEGNFIGMFNPLGSFINLVVKILGIFDPLPPPFVVTFTKYGLCYKMVIWLTPLPPQLSTWFIYDP